jgi:hypothetical protein
MNGEIRDREKTMRGIKRNAPSCLGLPDLPQLHTTPRSIAGKTPAEACGITIEGEDKWIT